MFVRRRPSSNDGIDVQKTEDVWQMFDGMICGPMVMVEGQMHIARFFNFEDVSQLSAIVNEIRSKGVKTYLRGVYPKNKRIRLTMPAQF